MHTFAQKPKAAQQTTSAKSTIPGRGHFGHSPEVRSIFHLQRTRGNQAVQRMLQTDAEEPEVKSTGLVTPRFGHDFSRIPIHPPAAGAIQTKLAINEPGDSYEQEADRVADMVMRMPEPTVQRECATCGAKSPTGGECPECKKKKQGLGGTLQRLSTQGDSAAGMAAPPIVSRVLSSPGSPLPADTRGLMEQRFGHDFSRVRLHTGAAAEQSAKEVNANAYAVGHNIVFGSGQFAPGTQKGQRLLAHELTHVVQQSENPAPASQATEATAKGPQTSVSHHTDVHLARDPLTSGAASVPAVQNRAEAVQRIFRPDLSLDALMRRIESIRPSESASGLYTLVWEGQTLTITQAEYDRIRTSARQSLLDGLRKVRRKTEDAQNQYDAQHMIDEDQYIVSGIVRFVGGINDPGESIHGNTRRATLNANAAQASIERGELVRAAEFLAVGERFAIDAKTSSQTYVDNVISTAEVTTTVLEVTAVAAAATVVVIAAILAAPAVIAAAQAAPLVVALGTGAVSTAPVVAVETAAVVAPAVVAAAAPAAVAVAAPAAVAIPAAAAVAVPATAAVAVPATAAASTLTTAAVATAGVVVASTTLSSDSPKPSDPEKKQPRGKYLCTGPCYYYRVDDKYKGIVGSVPAIGYGNTQAEASNAAQTNGNDQIKVLSATTGVRYNKRHCNFTCTKVR